MKALGLFGYLASRRHGHARTSLVHRFVLQGEVARSVRLAGVVGCLLACAPRAAPLTGVAPVNATFPRIELPPGSRKVTFTWEINQESMVIRGDGVIRLSAPDSARVDLFIGGGFGGASAILLGDSTRTPPGASMTNLIPSPPLLWAALGRLALPSLPDTVVRVAGDTIRAEIGRPAQWRIATRGDTLTRVERIANGRIVEWVERLPDHVQYEVAGRRSLTLKIQQDSPAVFDASIWTY